MNKKFAVVSIVLLFAATVFFGWQASKLQFDYNFEHFFPAGDEDLEYFLEFRKKYENDNDYLLIAIENSKGVFNSGFLGEVDSLTNQLKRLNYVDDVFSPTKLNQPIISPFGVIQKPILHLNSDSTLKQDSVFVFESEELLGSFFSKDKPAVCIVVKNMQVITKQASDKLLHDIEKLINEFEFDKVHIAGKIKAQQVYLDKMRSELAIFSVFSVILVVIFLFVGFRSGWGVWAPLATVFTAIIWVLGIMSLLGSYLDLMTSLLPIILLVVGMSDCVHIISKYFDELRAGENKIDAIKIVFREVGLAVFLTSLTTAVGFISLVTINVKPLAQFGYSAAIGVFVAYGVSIVLLSSVLVLLKKPEMSKQARIKSYWQKWLHRWFLVVLNHPKKIVLGFAVLTLLSFVALSQIKVNYFLLGDLSEKEELKQNLRYIENNFSGVRPFEMVVNTNSNVEIFDYEVIKELNKFQEKIKEIYGTGFMLSPVSLVKSLNKATHSGIPEYYKIPSSETEYNQLKQYLPKLKELKFSKLMFSEDYSEARFTGKMHDIGSLKISDCNDSLESFYLNKIDNDLFNYKLTGTATLIDKNTDDVTTNMLTTLGLSFLLIALIVGFLFKSVRLALLSLVPNLIPLFMMGGLMAVMKVPLNISTSIIFTIAFGIAVDDTIHFLSRFKIEINKGKTFFYALKRTYLSTGKGIIITTLILSAGFFSLGFSNFKSTHHIGLYVTLILLIAVVADLLLLPVLLMWMRKRFK